jgi:flagellar motor switch protein FliM
MRGVLAHGGLTVRELLELEPGHVIPLGKAVTEPATLDLEGVPRFTARAGNVNGRRALRVLSVIPKGEHP